MPDVTAIITLTYQAPSPANAMPIWRAATGHPNIPGSYLSAGDFSPSLVLKKLGDVIEHDPVTFLKAQNITIVYPDT